jgi:hypothetical protein
MYEMVHYSFLEAAIIIQNLKGTRVRKSVRITAFQYCYPGIRFLRRS